MRDLARRQATKPKEREVGKNTSPPNRSLGHGSPCKHGFEFLGSCKHGFWGTGKTRPANGTSSSKRSVIFHTLARLCGGQAFLQSSRNSKNPPKGAFWPFNCGLIAKSCARSKTDQMICSTCGSPCENLNTQKQLHSPREVYNYSGRIDYPQETHLPLSVRT